MKERPTKRAGRPFRDNPPGTVVPVTVQMPAEMKAHLQGRALENNRTLSQEVVLILKDAQAGPTSRNQREFGVIAGKWATRIGQLLQFLEKLVGHPNRGVLADTWAKMEVDELTKTIDALRQGDSSEALRITTLKPEKSDE